MSEKISIAELADRWAGRSAQSIALETAALIRAGVIPVGARLPAVRDLANAIGVSPATISAAWSELRRYQVIEGRGRNGVRVASSKVSARPLRFESVGNFGENVVADLTAAAPDPGLLPDLSKALAEGLKVRDLNSYRNEPISEGLERVVRRRWPYEAEAFLATNGGYEGVQLALQALLLPGSVVAVEDPSAVRLLDILDHQGAHVVPVACDESGPLPDALRTALQRKPAAFIYQPRVHATTGAVVSKNRMKALENVLRETDILIVEDDGIGDLAGTRSASLGRSFPSRTVHVLSYSKSLGPDLRLGVLSSSKQIVEQIQAFRNFGARWTSRILQTAVGWLLDDSGSQAAVDHARAVYAERRMRLLEALSKRGVSSASRDGLSIWVPVESEQFAMVTLAARGIAVSPGARYCTNRSWQHIRVSTSMLKEQQEVVADAIALAVKIG